MPSPAPSLSVRAILTDETGRVLLLQRPADTRHYANQWEFPGGKVGVGEALEAALAREVSEETGLIVHASVRADVGTSEVDGKEITTFFDEVACVGGTARLSDEHVALAWVKPEELATRDLVSSMREPAQAFVERRLTGQSGEEERRSQARLDAQVRVYRAVRPQCSEAIGLLVDWLQGQLAQTLPLVQVEGRVKSVVSFAEKLLRKKKYADPLRQVTDLCGVRVLLSSELEVAEAGRLIRRHLPVDEANSLDALSRLRTDEFGYRSVHYVVRLDRRQLPFWPVELDGLSAEIQVRTWLQHVQATVDHDRIYKSPCPLPAGLKRERARLAAQLESVEAGVQRLAGDIDAWHAQLSAALDARAGTDERMLLNTLQKHEPANQAVALRRLRLEIADGGWSEAARLARAYVEELPAGEEPAPEFQSLGGCALCRTARAAGDPAAYQEGLRWLLRATSREASSSKAWVGLGEMQALAGDASAATESFQRAYELTPAELRALSGFIRNHGRTFGVARLARLLAPTVHEALKCHTRQTETGLALAGEHFRAAWLALLLTDAGGARELFMKGVAAVRFVDEIDDAIALLPLSDSEALQGETSLMVRVLRLVKNVRFPGAESVWLRAEATPMCAPIAKPVVLVAGSCAESDSEALNDWQRMLKDALQRFRGSVISGSTQQGIAGLVGGLDRVDGGLRVIGYLPKRLPDDGTATRDERYDELRTTNGESFSALEPLQAWIDMIASGVDPKNVMLLGMGGGEIAAFEYRLALVLGAKVIVVTGTGRAADALVADPAWTDAKLHLTPLPRALADARALEALLPDEAALPASVDLEKLGEQVHKDYLQQNLYSDVDPVRAKWTVLREDLKESNRDQIAAAMRILATEGYAVVPKADAAGAVGAEFPEDELNRMAEREHARWNLERLRSGWRFGPVKNAAEKRSPWLVAWARLPDEIKQYDRNAIGNYVKILGAANLAIVRHTQ